MHIEEADLEYASTGDPPTPPADHRTLATAQKLFITSPYSPGSPLFLPNGAYMFNKLISFLRAQYHEFGFREVVTPTIYKRSLWQTSGHWDNYAKDMFEVQGRGATGRIANVEAGQDEEFGLKPMNCPGHCLLFASERRSYRDLPIRFADFSALHRNEISGALSGLTRVRRFHQDDGHIFCTPSQILDEIRSTLEFIRIVYDTFNLGPYKLVLSTRPTDSHIGTQEEWDRAEGQLKDALMESGREWGINEGDGAFYGPKIDIILKDSDGKEHQTATIQLDFQLGQRFGLEYIAPAPESDRKGGTSLEVDNELKTNGPFVPVIIHRAIFGSLERFLALLIEHYNGKYPFWISPRPAIILSVTQDPDVIEYISKIKEQLSSGEPNESSSTASFKRQKLGIERIHIDTDLSHRHLNKKIAEAKSKGYNNIIVVGGRDVRENGLSLEIWHQDRLDDTLRVRNSIRGTNKMATNDKMTVPQVVQFFQRLQSMYL
ncbi:class II aaRS and biotin synthetase [Patellaria atrata CBS 101060]|uniref:threonine--tRNA ligase n=1 Tax=Patellaria atrata CBS 101060 TaxID=1346257 RepID=A0A9P4SBL1_9PEZI|nr:class II aaRS and biotin synthetase [Patellaria atrata CBS 101060]